MDRATRDQRILQILRGRGLAVFEGRIIRDARPGIDEATLARVRGCCAADLPRDLVDLWRASFGGTLDYTLRVDFDGHVDHVGCTELFYPDSDGYHDLWGWIDDARMHRPGEIRAANVDPSAPLQLLPIAGREWLSRIFVDVSGGLRHGHVYALREGIAPAGRLRLAHDAFAHVADSVRGMFGRLVFEHDPLAPAGDLDPGCDQLRRIYRVLNAGTIDEELAAQQLRTTLQHALLDWRGALASDALKGQPMLEVLALEQVARTNDLSLLARLIRADCRWTRPLRARGTLLDHAMYHSAWSVVDYCLAGDEFSVRDTIRNAASDVSWELVEQLLNRGAQADALAAHQAAARGNTETARTIAIHLALNDPQAAQQLRSDVHRLIGELQARCDEDEASPRQREAWRQEAAHFRSLASCLDVCGSRGDDDGSQQPVPTN